MWDLTESQSISAKNSSGATASPIPCLVIPAHQSGINSLAVWAQKLERQEDGCLVTVASGGDDGQLTVSTMRVQYPEEWKVGGSRGLSHISYNHTPLDSHDQSPNQFQLHIHSQFSIPLAHAASLTALKLLSPGLLVSTSSDQRVCLWRVSGTGISHSGALCSHVADAAGLAVWEDEKSDEKIGFESEQVNTALEAIVDPVCESNDVTEEEPADDPRNPVWEGDTNSGSCEGRKKITKVGWLLVCGQGFQLLRIMNPGMDVATSEKKKETENWTF